MQNREEAAGRISENQNVFFKLKNMQIEIIYNNNILKTLLFNIVETLVCKTVARLCRALVRSVVARGLSSVYQINLNNLDNYKQQEKCPPEHFFFINPKKL